ncbi:rab effector Noc2 isoform X1 [Latimeria chalumnae]|uniref:rab effector Noc2 isoform X1 n=1 Tax=Latimeria chalumnae TaxID=7897 RepID=UPI00313EB0CF
MTDTIFGNGTDQWVCPNDRQLALRAKLQTGWSVHTFQTDRQRKCQSLNQNEIEVILEVIKRAEKLDLTEQQRIGRLVERLENMRKNVMGNGMSQCLLCGEQLGILGTTSVFCQGCQKYAPNVELKLSTAKRDVCGFVRSVVSKEREEKLDKVQTCMKEGVWKRSGAWFYKGLPKYILPLKSTARSNELYLRSSQAEPSLQRGTSFVVSNRLYSWAKGRGL